MRTLLSLTVAGFSFAFLSATWGPTDAEIKERAKKIHETALVVDGHNDLPWALRQAGDMGLTKFDLNKVQKKFNTDIPRLKAGGLGAQFWSVYVPADLIFTGGAAKMTFEQIDLVHRLIKKYPQTFELALTADDIIRIRKAGKIASMIGMEGGHSIEDDLSNLKKFYDKGARYMTLTHSRNLAWADACTDKEVLKGLSPFGEQVVAEMNRLGMLVDISHVSPAVMRHVLRITKKPVIASHSSARGVKDHVRNVPDDVLKLVARNNGVVMVNFYTEFISSELLDVAAPLNPHSHAHNCEGVMDGTFGATVGTVVDHIDHIVKIAGIDHVGLGSDFDGVPTLPTGLEDVSKYPALTEELLKRGYDETSIRKILGLNLERVFRAAGK